MSNTDTDFSTVEFKETSFWKCIIWIEQNAHDLYEIFTYDPVTDSEWKRDSYIKFTNYDVADSFADRIIQRNPEVSFYRDYSMDIENYKGDTKCIA